MSKPPQPEDDTKFVATLKRMLQTPHKLHKDEPSHKRAPKAKTRPASEGRVHKGKTKD